MTTERIDPASAAAQSLREGRFSEARRLLEKDAWPDPEDARRYFLLGVARHFEGHGDGAAEAIARALSMCPASPAEHEPYAPKRAARPETSTKDEAKSCADGAFACSAPWELGWITVDGEIRPCSRFGQFDRLRLEGGVTVADAWHSPQYVELRRKFANGEMPSEHCRRCHEASTYSTVGKDLRSVHIAHFAELGHAVGLSDEAAKLRDEIARLFHVIDFNRTELPQELLSSVGEALRRGKALGAGVHPAMGKLLTILQVAYDFYTRNPYPSIVMPFRVPELTGRCNARCIMCNMVISDALDNGRNMSDDIVELSLGSPESMPKMWPARTEFLLHPQWRRILSILKENRTFTSIATNGAPLNPAASDFLVEHRADELGISINGATAEVFESIMQRVPFEKFKRNVSYFVEVNRKHGSPVGLGFTMVAMSRNLPQLPYVIKLLYDIVGPGAHLHVSSLDPPKTDAQRAFYAENHPSLLGEERLRQIFEASSYAAEKLGVNVRCFYYSNIEEILLDLSRIPRVQFD